MLLALALGASLLAADAWPDSARFLFQDASLARWFVARGEGVYRLDGDSLTVFTTRDGLGDGDVRSIQQDRAGTLYFESATGVTRFDGNAFEVLPPVDASDDRDAWRLHPDDLWFAGDPNQNGPHRFDGETLYRLKLPPIALERVWHEKYPNAPFSPYGVYSLHRDAEGAVWFGTSSFGVCRFDGESLRWITEDDLTELDAGPANGVRGIAQDRDGRFWFGHVTHRYEVNGAAEEPNALDYAQLEGIPLPRGPNGDAWPYYMSVTTDEAGDLWMATYGQGVWHYDGSQLRVHEVRKGDAKVHLFSIECDREGVLWAGSLEHGAFRFDGRKFVAFRP